MEQFYLFSHTKPRNPNRQTRIFLSDFILLDVRENLNYSVHADGHIENASAAQLQIILECHFLNF